MKTYFKQLCALLMLVAGGALVSPVYADSSDECGGNLVEVANAKAPSGTIVGSIQLYYNAQNGLNCALFKHSDATWNKPLYTTVNLYECLNADCSSVGVNGDYKNSDSGVFRFAAGPTRQPGRGKCIQAFGYIITKRGQTEAGPNTVYAKTRQHCG